MQRFPACYANLATVNQTVTNITVTTLCALRAVTHVRQKRHARARARGTSDATPSNAAPLAD